jgi:hypothetical protein
MWENAKANCTAVPRCRVVVIYPLPGRIARIALESAFRVEFFVRVWCTKSEKRRKVYFQRDVFPKNRAVLFLRYASCTRGLCARRVCSIGTRIFPRTQLH